MRIFTKYFLTFFFLITFWWVNEGRGQNIWKGEFSNDWDFPGNWSNGVVPNNNTDVIFDSNFSNLDCQIFVSNFSAQAKSITIKSNYSGTISVKAGETVLSAENISFEPGTNAIFDMEGWATCNIHCYNFDMQGGTFKGSTISNSGLQIYNDNSMLASSFKLGNTALFIPNQSFLKLGSGTFGGGNLDIIYENNTTSVFNNVEILSNDNPVKFNSDMSIQGKLTLSSGRMDIGVGTPKINLGRNDNISTYLYVESDYQVLGNLPIHFVGDGNTFVGNANFFPISNLDNPIVINKNYTTIYNGKVILNVDTEVSELTLTQGVVDTKGHRLLVKNTLNYTLGNDALVTNRFVRRVSVGTPFPYFFPLGYVDSEGGGRVFFASELTMSSSSGSIDVEVNTSFFGGAIDESINVPLVRKSKRMYWTVNNTSASDNINIADVKLYAFDANTQAFQGITSFSNTDLNIGYNTGLGNIQNLGTSNNGINYAGVSPSPFLNIPASLSYNFIFASANSSFSSNPLGNTPPPGETCSSAFSGLNIPFYNESITISTTNSQDTPLLCGSEPAISRDIWYSLGSLSQGNTYTFEFSSSKAVGIALYYSPNDCNNISLLNCDNSFSVAKRSVKVSYSVSPFDENNYYIRLIDWNGGTTALNDGTLTIRKSPTADEVYDLSATAKQIIVNDSPIAFNIPLSFQNHEGRGTSSCLSVTNKNDGWVKFTASSASTIIKYINSNQDAAIVIYSSLAGGTDANVEITSPNACFNEVVGVGTENITFPTTQGTTYFVRIINVTSGANMNGTIEIKNAPPDPPTNLTFSNITNTSVSVGYTASVSAGVVDYTLEYSFSNSPFSPIAAGTLSNQTANPISVGTSLPQLLANTTYYVRMRANNGITSSANSVVGSFTTKTSAVPLLTPTSLTTNSFQANWTLVGGANYYLLDVSTNINFLNANILAGYNGKNVGNVSTALVDNLAPNTIYYYRVRAMVNGVESVNPTTTAVRSALTKISAPVAIAATNVITTGFRANWQTVSGASEYKVYRDTNPNFANSDSVTTTNLFTDFTGLLQNTTYYYRVKTVVTSPFTNISDFSNVIVVNTLVDIPAPASINASNVTSTSFTLTWDAVANIDEYRLDVSTDNSFTTGFVTNFNNRQVSANLTSINVNALSPSITYYFRIRAKIGNDYSVYTINNATTAISSPLAPIANTALSIQTTQFTAFWGSVANATSYDLDVSTTNDFSANIVSFNAIPSNTFTLSSAVPVTAGTIYYYRVRAVNAGGASAYSNIVSLITTPNTPTTTNVTSNAFTLNWSTALGATSYTLQVSDNSGFTNFIYNQNVNGTNQTISSGLNANTQYFFRIKINANTLTSDFSANGNVTTSVSAPNSPVLLSPSNIGLDAFQVNWQPSINASSYELDVATNNTFTNIVQNISNISSTVISQNVSTNINAGTIYYYRLRAINTSGASAYTIATPLITTPKEPIVVGTITSTSFTLNWLATLGATNYTLQVSDNNAFTSFVYNQDITNTTQTISSGLSAGIQYFFRIRINANTPNAINSDFSAIGSVTTLPTTPTAPVALSASNVGLDTFQANWQPVANANTYELDIATNNTFTNIVGTVSGISSTNQIVNTNINAGTIYYYRVRAINNAGVSINSNIVSFITDPNAPTATDITSSSFVVNWVATSGATSYTLQVSDNNGFTNFIYNQNVSGVSQLIQGLNVGTPYFFRIKINANTLISNFSANGQATPTLQAPAAPVAISATDIANISFTANWQLSSGATSYELDIALDNGFTNIINNFTNLTSTSQVITGLVANTTYFYQVRAKNTAGTSTNSNSISVTTANTTGNIPEIPTDLSPFALSSTTIEISWQDESANETGFELQRKTGLTGNYVTIYTAPANASGNPLVSYVDDNLTPNTKYYYQVRALGIIGNSPYSVENSTTTLPENIVPPTFLEASTASSNSVELNWVDNADNETGYKVYRAKQGDPNFTDITSNPLPANITTFTDVITPSNIGEIYFYYVVALKNVTQSQPSNISGAILANVPIKPTNFVATSTSPTTASLTWQDNSNNEDNFILEIKSLTSNGFFVFLKEVPANTTNTTITGLLPNQQYTFKMYAENSAGESPSVTSNEINTLIDTNIETPNTPTEPYAEAISTVEIGIRWKYSKAGEAVMFRILRSNTNTPSSFVEVGRILANKLSFNDTKGIVAGTTYYYRIIAANGGGNSQPSAIVSVKAECNVTTVINTDQAGSGNISCDTKQVLLQLSTNVTVGRLQWFKNGLAISGATFSSYIATETGEYYCRILAGDCDKKTEVKSVLIVPSFIVQISYVNDRLTSNRLGAGTYQWYYEYEPISGAVQDNYVPTRAGVYYLMVTQGSCSVVSNLFTFAPTALEVSFSQALQIYPNPAQDEISLKIEHPQMGDFEVFAVDMQGKRIELLKGYKDETIFTQKINVSHLNTSVYFLEVNMKGLKGQKKLVKL